MSGVCGLYYRDGDSVDEATMCDFARTLDHRGPDGSHTVEAGPVGFAHQRFETTPESAHERLPRTNGGLTITADARIDNRDELRARLDVGRHRGVVTDSELVLEAYREWGRDAPKELVGAFAFAIWDPDAGHLFCARDHTGLRPLYYSLSDDRFLFASEPDAISSRDGVTKTLDERRVGDYLAGIHADHERTFYSDVKRLPPAETLTVTADDAQRRRYWELDPDREIDLESDEAYAEAFREQFEEAVRCRLRTNGPVGTFLSGGLDSSSVTCVANEYLRERGTPHYTFSVVFDEVPESDEREYIHAVVDECDVRPRFVAGDQTGALSNRRAMLDATGEPFAANMLFLHWGLYRAVNNSEADVVLGGYGGDATVSHGVGRFLELALGGHPVRLTSEISAFASKFDRSIRSVFTGYVVSPFVPDRVKRAYHAVLGDEVHRRQRTLLNEKFADRVELDKGQSQNGSRRGRATTERERHYRTLESGISAADLETTNEVASFHGVEHRHPFLDKRLVEFCLALPAEQKLRRGWSRYVLREAMSRYLPSVVQWRPQKTSVAPVFDRALRHFDAPDLRTIVETQVPALAEYVDVDAVEQTYEAVVKDGVSVHATDLWKVGVLATWVDQDGGGNPPEQPKPVDVGQNISSRN